MKKTLQRSLSCLLTLAMVVSMLMTSTFAADKSAKLEFGYSANYDSSKVVSLEVNKGYPADSYAKEEEIFSQLEAITRRLTAATSSPLPAPMPTMCTAPATTTFSSSST